jgi:hypothetical protein
MGNKCSKSFKSPKDLLYINELKKELNNISTFTPFAIR